MKAYIQTAGQMVLAGASFLDSLDVSIRILCGLASLVLFFFAIRAHISKTRLTDLEHKIKEAEMNERFKSNGHGKH